VFDELLLFTKSFQPNESVHRENKNVLRCWQNVSWHQLMRMMWTRMEFQAFRQQNEFWFSSHSSRHRADDLSWLSSHLLNISLSYWGGAVQCITSNINTHNLYVIRFSTGSQCTLCPIKTHQNNCFGNRIPSFPSSTKLNHFNEIWHMLSWINLSTKGIRIFRFT